MSKSLFASHSLDQYRIVGSRICICKSIPLNDIVDEDDTVQLELVDVVVAVLHYAYIVALFVLRFHKSPRVPLR